MARAVRITIDTQESLTPDQTSELFALYEKLGHFFFLEKPDVKIDTSTLPEIRLEAGEKSPGQRLRAALYIYWEQRTDIYRRWMERAIVRHQ